MVAWIAEQVAYWYGSNYSDVIASSWQSIERLLERSDYRKGISRYPTIADGTIERILECYSGLPDYNTHGNAEVVEDIRKHDVNKRLTTAHSLPILMVDEIGLDLPVISYNRLADHPKSRVFFWPNSYHVGIAQSGKLDKVSFSEKQETVIFRGALSGPMKNIEIAPGINKVSRAQFILNLPVTEKRLDIGITYIPPQLLSDPTYLAIEDQIQRLLSDRVPMEEIFRHKYVLCLEGSDISSGFGGVLASYCVPLHVYPFCYSTWFFNGLKPWVHFVPVRPDGSDLLDLLDYCERHTVEMERIGMAGRNHMSRISSPSALTEMKKAFVNLWDLRLS